MTLRERLAKLIYPKVFRDRDDFSKQEAEQFKLKVAAEDKVWEYQRNCHTILDLTRANLKLTPLSIEYSVDLEKYDKEDYLVHAVELLENPMFQEEIKRIMFEQVNYIAMQSPNEQSNLISRGSINGVSLLKERIESYKEIFEQKLKDRKEDAEVSEVTGIV